MKFNEILWVIKTLNLKPIQDLEITSYDNRFTILSPTKRVDIINENCRYIRIYNNSKDLSAYFQTNFDKYMGKSKIDISDVKIIDTREYETQEDLEKAMYQTHRDQLVQLMHGKYGMVKSDIEQMLSLIQYPFANKCAALDRHTIYWTADRIEELAKRLALTCSIMKSACRLILDESKEKEDANRSATSISESN